MRSQGLVTACNAVLLSPVTGSGPWPSTHLPALAPGPADRETGRGEACCPQEFGGLWCLVVQHCWKVEVGTRRAEPWGVWLRNRDKHAVPVSRLVELMLPVKLEAKGIILRGEAGKATFGRKRWASPPSFSVVGNQLPH